MTDDDDVYLQALLSEYGIEESTLRNDSLEDTILPPQDELPEWCNNDQSNKGDSYVI